MKLSNLSIALFGLPTARSVGIGAFQNVL
ncbi:uncharacterized protein RAG0_10927 [Rhynchosporium agropyri]|uniref:Uncharacterized protein n=3 Tax=Rhynchosporium TaxID=38037 RepID=A0A1E1M5V4_RHYSE|nr:uncharacterized protein RAG0_10927 [Rhynchosporium agropyri]CZT09568.1 uncharacterized protein RCO7_03689 [Rhynchosporium commune]CZT44476.1 uncharacterized protein RSE6_16055 [Rhynchosporium secalis]